MAWASASSAAVVRGCASTVKVTLVPSMSTNQISVRMPSVPLGSSWYVPTTHGSLVCQTLVAFDAPDFRRTLFKPDLPGPSATLPGATLRTGHGT